jgi:D-glycero-D-manno-heptose 1,7-bisphosphate phosphatase
MPTSARPKLVILDRDGVINQESAEFIKTPDEWIPIPGALEAIARISQAGYTVVIATNQSGLGRGLFDAATLNAIHAKLEAKLAQLNGKVEAIFICPHRPDEGCDCRKPLPGLYRFISERFEIDLHGVPSVGDSARDLEAAAAAGCQPWLVLTGNGPKTLAQGKLPAGTVVWQDLDAVADALEEAAAKGEDN